eukprot:9467031-Pyramimonas_sp.AAC.1
MLNDPVDRRELCGRWRRDDTDSDVRRSKDTFYVAKRKYAARKSYGLKQRWLTWQGSHAASFPLPSFSLEFQGVSRRFQTLKIDVLRT